MKGSSTCFAITPTTTSISVPSMNVPTHNPIEPLETLLLFMACLWVLLVLCLIRVFVVLCILRDIPKFDQKEYDQKEYEQKEHEQVDIEEYQQADIEERLNLPF
jgi:hypothetical protein